MAGKFTIEAIFKGTDRFSGMLGSIQSRTSRFASGVGGALNSVSAQVDRFTGALKHAAVAGAALAAVGVGAGLMHVAESGLHFEQAITDVGSVMGKTRAQIAELEESAKHLGIVTQFSSTEVAEGMEMMARKGFHAHEILSMMPGVLDAVAASGEDMKGVSTIVGSALRSFQLDAGQAAHVADVLSFASERVGATMSDMGTALAIAGPTAKTLGVSIEDTAAAVGLLQKIGIDASTAGSATATMLAKLSHPPKEVAAQMTAMGIKFDDAKGNMLSFRDVLGQLVKAGDKAGGNMKRMAFLADLVGLRGDKAAIGLADMLKSGDFDTLADGLKKVDGYAKLVATRRLDTTNMSWKLLGSTVEVLNTEIYELESKQIRSVIDGTNQWIQANRKLIVSGVREFLERGVPLVKDFGIGFANGFSDSIGPLREVTNWTLKLVGALPGLGTAATNGEKLGRLAGSLFVVAAGVKAVTFAMGALDAVMDANPYTLVVMAVIGLGLAFSVYREDVKKFAHEHKVLLGVLGTAAGIFVAMKVAANAWIAAAFLVTTADKAMAAATWAAEAARGALAATTRVAGAAETLFTGEVVASTAAAEASTVAVTAAEASFAAFAATIGVATAALAAWGVAWYEWQQLKTSNKGADIGEAFLEGVGAIGGKGFIAGMGDSILAQQDAAAKRDFYARQEAQPADAAPAAAATQLVGPEKIAQSVIEKKEVHEEKVSIEIKTPEGTKADVQQKAGSKVPIKATNSGAFGRKK